mmetsp:Transcript_1449/g.4988  ORF Transcript_1449/g.4988 Transcript_1449/m.4988 type:complete len:208 (+) Transcript_1449:413-1036(+)
MTPHAPLKPCTGEASTTSSMLRAMRSLCAPMYTKAEMTPMTKAPSNSTVEHPAVMATRPERMPLLAYSIMYWWSTSFPRKVVTRQPVAAAMVVVTAVRPALSEAPPEMTSVETQLKPYHPTHRMSVPSVWKMGDCPTMVPSVPSGLKRPLRGPIIHEPMKAATPPVMCTTPEPAKSTAPHPKRSSSFCALRKAEAQPSAHTQCTTTG